MGDISVDDGQTGLDWTGEIGGWRRGAANPLMDGGGRPPRTRAAAAGPSSGWPVRDGRRVRGNLRARSGAAAATLNGCRLAQRVERRLRLAGWVDGFGGRAGTRGPAAAGRDRTPSCVGRCRRETDAEPGPGSISERDMSTACTLSAPLTSVRSVARARVFPCRSHRPVHPLASPPVARALRRAPPACCTHAPQRPRMS